MFKLMRPQKELVGKRIRIVKEELGVSLTELGNRLGLIKPTINSYVQGYTLAPIEIIKQLEKITGKSIGWFYFGEMEDYIRDYLVKKGFKQLLKDFPDLPMQLKQEFLNSKDESWDWKNEFGYPDEASIDDVFADIYDKIIKDYISKVTKEYISVHSSLNENQQEDAINLITAKAYDYVIELGEIKYGDREKLEKEIQLFYERDIKDKNISFDEEYLIGKLINILGNNQQTIDLINSLSVLLTNKGGINVMFGGKELVEVFQTMRPALIKLYSDHTKYEFYEWFEK